MSGCSSKRLQSSHIVLLFFLDDGHRQEYVHFVKVFLAFLGVTQSWLEVLECLFMTFLVSSEHHSHVVVREERFRLSCDRILIALFCGLSVTFALLNDTKVVANSHLVVERVFDSLERVNSFITLLKFLKSHGIVGACFLVSGRSAKQSLRVLLTKVH